MVASHFEEQVLQSKAGSWVIFFSAPWSGKTYAVAPVFGQLSLDFASCGLHFGEVNVADWPSLADQLKVRMTCCHWRQLLLAEVATSMPYAPVEVGN
jgi:thioredoxin-like negative regulator of GroEL